MSDFIEMYPISRSYYVSCMKHGVLNCKEGGCREAIAKEYEHLFEAYEQEMTYWYEMRAKESTGDENHESKEGT
jgi:hypothetical protein